MRIHWSIVSLAVIGSALLTWHLRTRHMDFMTPKGVVLPPEDDGLDLTVGLTPLQSTLQPEIAPSTTVDHDQVTPAETTGETSTISDADLGDLFASPGLAEYRDFAKANPPERLFELSSILRSRGQFQRALLAFERVIDQYQTDLSTLDEAATAIAALAPTLPKWTTDPENELSLKLQLSTARPASQALKMAILEVATLIKESSSDQLDIIPAIIGSDQAEAPAESPIAIWFSTMDAEPTTSSFITLRLPEDEAAFFPRISLAVFQAIRSHLGRLNYPPYPAAEANPEEGPKLLKTNITRLMWHDFAQSLLDPPLTEEPDTETPPAQVPAKIEEN